ncbi:hypothetical protein ACQ5RK_00395 [Latilactobacillus curvatus]
MNIEIERILDVHNISDKNLREAIAEIAEYIQEHPNGKAVDRELGKVIQRNNRLRGLR